MPSFRTRPPGLPPELQPAAAPPPPQGQPSASPPPPAHAPAPPPPSSGQSRFRSPIPSPLAPPPAPAPAAVPPAAPAVREEELFVPPSSPPPEPELPPEDDMPALPAFQTEGEDSKVDPIPGFLNEEPENLYEVDEGEAPTEKTFTPPPPKA